MLRITFKNVGQGDSIILEWKSDISEHKIGIIDCNLVDENTNPVLSYLQSTFYKEIDFILLSHPHYDHFSGLRQILEYCEEKNIFIKNFWHTSSQVPSYLRAAVKSTSAANELALLFKKIMELSRKGKVIGGQGYVANNTRDYSLSKDISLRFLAPSTKEFDKYIRKINLKFDEEDSKNTANANWLSTVIKISGNDWFILLTSDCESEVLKSLWINDKAEFEGKRLLLAQSPHHGAKGNHQKNFWIRQNPNRTNPYAVISVGKNHYGHPSPVVIQFFDKANYRVYSTNKVGRFVNKTKEDIAISSLLDISSSLVLSINKNDELAGDQVFVVQNGQITHQR